MPRKSSIEAGNCVLHFEQYDSPDERSVVLDKSPILWHNSALMSTRAKEASLHQILHSLDSVVVAFSAGVDSTYLLAACRDVLGAERVLAITAVSASLPVDECDDAVRIAQMLGVRLILPPTHELDHPRYRQNMLDRCFVCKDVLFETLRTIADAYHLTTIVYGATVDDRRDHRPGMLAAERHGARAPLLEAGLSKADIRHLSKERGLPTWDKPAMACLASRIPFGQTITAGSLHQVADAEQIVRHELGIQQVRVRHHGTIARIELDPDDFAVLLQPDVRERLVAALRHIGFTYITLDLMGFRSGSMHEALPPQENTRERSA